MQRLRGPDRIGRSEGAMLEQHLDHRHRQHPQPNGCWDQQHQHKTQAASENAAEGVQSPAEARCESAGNEASETATGTSPRGIWIRVVV